MIYPKYTSSADNFNFGIILDKQDQHFKWGDCKCIKEGISLSSPPLLGIRKWEKLFGKSNIFGQALKCVIFRNCKHSH